MSDESARPWQSAADEWGKQSAEAGDPTGWVTRLWSEAEAQTVDLPWDRTEGHPDVMAAVEKLGAPEGRRAVVVGAALGADAEALARAGWSTTAFDISEAAVRLAKERYPDSAVDYQVADLLDLPEQLRGAFDVVVEIYTVQAMPPAFRDGATAGIRALLAPGGRAFVIQYVRGDADPDVGPPWLLDEAQMRSFAADDVELESLTTNEHPTHGADAMNWFAILRRS